MRKGVIVGAFLLSSCGGPSLSQNQREEVENIAEDFADGTSTNAATNFDNSEIESKVDNLESRIADMDAEIALLRKQNLEDANAAAELERRINELRH